MEKRGGKILGILFLINIILIFSVSIISASLLTDIQDFFENFFKGKETVSSNGELLSTNPINVNTVDLCICGTEKCIGGRIYRCTITHPCYWYDAGSCSSSPVCGDGYCNGGETCTSCPADCRSCSPVCGDRVCNGAETCSTCSSDCGTCSCIPDWECTSWSSCANGRQTRICSDSNNCGTTSSKPSESRPCTSCEDKCSTSGKKICTSQTTYQVCGNYDSDSCLELGKGKKCPLGKKCFRGDCVSKNTCTDSDMNNEYPSGDNPFLRGIASKGLETSADLCYEANKKIFEYSCFENKIVANWINCEQGCKDGACINCKYKCLPTNDCRISKCNPATKTCTETKKPDGSKCGIYSASSLGTISPVFSFFKLFGLELTMTQEDTGYCKNGECIECNEKKECQKDKKELICKNHNVYERTISYKCVKGKCQEYIKSEVLKQECNQYFITNYNCKCQYDSPYGIIEKDYYSVCTTTRVIGGECQEKYSRSGEVDPHCSYITKSEDQWLKCGSSTSLGVTFSNCINNIHSPDFGHCKDNCNPKCDPECQYCFTWTGDSKCYNHPDEKTCRLSAGGYGQCKNGKCELSKCNPVPRECQFCSYSKTEKKYLAAPDPRKNGMDCIDNERFISGTAFCWNGECIEKSCENIGDVKCGNSASSSFQTCCNKNTEICCGNQNSAFCCNMETEVCSKALNVNGYKKIQDNLKKTIQYFKEIMKEYSSDPSKITNFQWAKIWTRVFNYYNNLQKNTLFDDNNDYFNYCSPKNTECSQQGKKICSGTHGSSCCPKTGPGSTCVNYQIIDPEILKHSNDMDYLLKDIPEGYAKEMLKNEIRDKTPSYGLCGDKTCPAGTSQCFGNSFNIFNNGVLCCKNNEEICNSRPTSWDSKDSILPFPREIVTEFPPRCEPAIYCSPGYTTCKLTEISIADSIFRSKKLCCKIGSEVCFTEPSISYARCVPLPKR